MSAEATSCGSTFHSVSDAWVNENENCELFKEGACQRCKLTIRLRSGETVCEKCALLLHDVNRFLSEM